MANLKSMLCYPCILLIGTPGSGKTTFLTALCQYAYKHNMKVFSNCEINNTYQITKDDIGFNLMEDGLLCVDEAGIDFNGRSWKSMPPETIRYLKLIRHYGMRSIWASQDADCDATIRRLASKVYLIRRSRIPGFITAVPVKCTLAPNETHDICMQYDLDHSLIRLFTSVRIYARRYYKHFDSWSRYELPQKDFRYLKF